MSEDPAIISIHTDQLFNNYTIHLQKIMEYVD